MAVSALEKYRFRKSRVRAKVFGTKDRPRLSVYRSLKHIYAQVIDDSAGRTILSASSLDPSLSRKKGSGGKKGAASLVGKVIAEKSLKSNIKKVVFDRGGRIYHGCIKAVADGAREGGLDF